MKRAVISIPCFTGSSITKLSQTTFSITPPRPRLLLMRMPQSVPFAHVDAAWAELSWENVVWVGADEMNRRKGHNYLTVFVDLEAKRVLLAVEGKDATVWERFAAELGRHNGHPKAITQVAIDMSPAYIKGVKENLGQATIVFDKFHVVSQVVE